MQQGQALWAGGRSSLISPPGCHRLIAWKRAHPPNVRENEGTAPPLPHWPFGWEKWAVSGPFWPWAIIQALLAGLFSSRFNFWAPKQSVAPHQGPGECYCPLPWSSWSLFSISTAAFTPLPEVWVQYSYTKQVFNDCLLNCYIRDWMHRDLIPT